MNVQPLGPAVVILAAGEGRRLGGRAKASLLLDGVSLLERLAAALAGAGAGPLRVVLGAHCEQLWPLAQRCGAQVLVLPPGGSLVESQLAALHAHAGEHPQRDVLLMLADLPLLRSADIAHVLAAWAQRAPEVEALIPSVQGVRGHPLVLSAAAVQAVLRAPGTAGGVGIRAWLQARGQERAQAVAFLPCTSPGYVSDLDTPEDLAALRHALPGVEIAWER